MAQTSGGGFNRNTGSGYGGGNSNAAAGAMAGAMLGSGGGSSKKNKNKGNGGGGGGGGGGGYGGGGYGGGGGGGGGYGGGVGSNSSGSISHAAPPPAPKPPSLADFLAKDSAYSTQKSSLAKAKSDYAAQQAQAQTQYLTGYASDADTLKQNRTSSLADLENDYAGRGMMNSGLYADSLATTTNDWDKRNSQLEQAKAAFLSGLTNDATNFSQEQLIALQKAQAEASARRAAQYGL